VRRERKKEVIRKSKKKEYGNNFTHPLRGWRIEKEGEGEGQREKEGI